jgi:hypothetical protein
VSAIVKIQEILGVTPDGIWGLKTQAALDSLIQGYSGDTAWHSTTATSFADPEDVRKFKECKAQGHSDEYCFNYGDNAIGTSDLGGHSTAQGTGPSCALPSKAWKPFGSAAEKKQVVVEVNGKTATVELKDTSGTRDVIDLNPDACVLLGLAPPVKEPARWKWA